MGAHDAQIERAAEAIAGAEAIIVGAGAGMGVDSGLPDFRGDEGFWRAYPPFAERNLSFVDMANPRWFDEEPELAWGFYGHRLHLYRDTEPHRGFEILRGWGAAREHGAFVYTSNVDGQFQKAGFAEQRVVECHGSIVHMQCAEPCHSKIWDGSEVSVEVDEETFRAARPLPECEVCGGLARPNILMFGDFAWIGGRSADQGERFERWLEGLGRGVDAAVVECGAGTAVPTVRRQCEHLARSLDAPLVRINPRESHGPTGTISLPMGAAEALAAIDAHLT
jgi:NAD-dependent SIR2 family protein deacetylase